MYRIISLLFAFSLLVSCGQGTKKPGMVADQEILPVSVDDFISDASPFIDKAVSISGTVVHVCRHGGQRMFVVGENGEQRVRITTGEDIPEFDIELEGEKVEVTGIVKELIIDETYLAEWEAEVLEGSKRDRGEGHEGGVGHGDQHGDSPETDLAEDEDNTESAEHSETDETEQDAEEMKENQLNKIQKVRDELAESGKDHLSDFWIESIEFKVIKE